MDLDVPIGRDHQGIGAPSRDQWGWRADIPAQPDSEEPYRGSDHVEPPVPCKPTCTRRAGSCAVRSKVALEICCGHAGLTAELYDVGSEAVGVGWKGNKHDATIPYPNC